MAVFSSSATTTHLLLRNLLRRPIHLTTTTKFSLLHLKKPTFSLFKSSTHLFTPTSPPHSSLENKIVSVSEEEEEEEKKIESEKYKVKEKTVLEEKRKLPSLSVKEKKELCSYANGLGDKLKSQQVGKSGVTHNVVFALNETLEANELLKLKIHRSCPGEMEDIMKQLEQDTGSVVVGQIGRTVILYRPSLSKLKAEEKKEQALRLLAQRRKKFQTTFMKQRREYVPRRPGRFENRRSEKVPS